MDERRIEPRRRILKTGRLAFNHRQSVIECLVRNFSTAGACLEVVSQAGIPPTFDLEIDGEAAQRHCSVAWRSDNKIGVKFHGVSAGHEAEGDGAQRREPAPPVVAAPAEGVEHPELIRGELLALRAALDDVAFGVVLLDAALRAQFINRAFRKMWNLPDAKAATKPAFVALMRHGSETGAYEIAPQDIQAYIADRVEAVIAGDATPRDLRLTNGEVLRFQCAILPDGGRMLSYTYVTDIVRQSDQLAMLRAAFDNVEAGVILLDADLNAQFMNRAARRLWRVPDEKADRRPPYAELVSDVRATHAYNVVGPELEALIALRLARVRAGSTEPMDLRTSEGRVIRARCALLPNGGRMLTYGDVTDLVRHADELEALARIDSLTGIANRRHFLEFAEIEWNRFERYQRPVSLVMIDIDNFKAVNDAYGHEVGDQALIAVARVCADIRRHADMVGRIGGEEFAVLLPETTLPQARMVAERLIRSVAQQEIDVEGGTIRVTASAGVAEASDSAADFAALMKRADQALYAAKAGGRNRVETAQSGVALAIR